MPTLLHPTYFPSILTMAVIAQKSVVWETWDNYQKQTYRNRCYIGTDQGRLMLNIPIQHVGGRQGRQLSRDVGLDNSSPWKRNHWRTLQTAYRASPFFEFFEEDLEPLFSEKHDSLLELNLATIEFICHCLDLKMPMDQTTSYEIAPQDLTDGRFLVRAKDKLQVSHNTYTQVFHDRHGFLENLSVLDLLFNEGPAALEYLETINLDFLYA